MQRTSLLICLALTMAAPVLAAQTGERSGPRAGAPTQPGGPQQQGPRMEELARELNLTAEQTAKLKTILEKQRQEMQAMRGQAQQERQAMMEKRRAMRDKRREELRTVLSSEQMDKLERYMEQHRPRMGPNGGRGPGGPGGQEQPE